jgi:hypothetical protein
MAGAEENGGDIGTVTKGMTSPALDEAIFGPELELETLSQPIRDDTTLTIGGYWLVQVVDKDENRELEAVDRELLKEKALSEWVSSLWDDPDNVVDDSYLNDEKKAWAINLVILGKS